MSELFVCLAVFKLQLNNLTLTIIVLLRCYEIFRRFIYLFIYFFFSDTNDGSLRQKSIL